MCVLDLALLWPIHDLGAVVLNNYQSLFDLFSFLVFHLYADVAFSLKRQYPLLPKYASPPCYYSSLVYQSIPSDRHSVKVVRCHHAPGLEFVLCSRCHQGILKRGPTLHRCPRLDFIHPPKRRRRLYSCRTSNTRMDPCRLGGWHQLLPKENQHFAFRQFRVEALTSAHGPVGPRGAEATSDACRIADTIHRNTDFMMYIARDENEGYLFQNSLRLP